MPNVARETIAAALYAKVNASVGAVVGLVTSSRALRTPMQVTPEQKPALFQTQLTEPYEHTFNAMLALPPKRTMKFAFLLYTADGQEPSVIPATQLNNMVNAVEAALVPDATTGESTLGGLVASARIDGTIEYVEGLIDGSSMAYVPISVLLP